MMRSIIKLFTLTIVISAVSAEALPDRLLLVENEDTSHIVGLDNKKTIRHGSAFNEPSSTSTRRETSSISNDLFILSVTIDPFHVIVPSVLTMNPEEVKGDIASTITNMKSGMGYDELSYVTLGDISVTVVDSGNRLLSRGSSRYLTQKTQIDLQGGDATFIVPTDPFFVSKDIFNQLMLVYLQDNLKLNGEGVEVGSGSIYSPSAQPSMAPSDPEAEVIVKPFESLEDESLILQKETSVSPAPVVVGALLAVFSVGVAATVSWKKRRNINSEISSSSPRQMRRDLDFEEFVVECCTDNDVFHDDNNYFTYPSQNHQ